MATPIRATPILTGKAARRFLKQVKENENKPVSREDYERAEKVYNSMKEKHSVLFN